MWYEKVKELELQIRKLEKENEELKKAAKENEIILNTDIGKMTAGVLTDPDYPGIYIDLNHKQEDFNLNGATIEYDTTEKDYIIRVWRKDNEDYVFRTNWSK